jgi:hypothetical protein
MRTLTFAAFALIAAAGVQARGAQAQPEAKKSEPAIFSGCVGEGVDKGTYYVANLRRTNLVEATIATEPNAIFALDSPRKLRDHVGRVVEIRGVVFNRKNTGKVDKDADAMKIDAEGRKPTRIPEGTPAAQAAASGGVGGQRVTYKVEVKEVKDLGTSCK